MKREFSNIALPIFFFAVFVSGCSEETAAKVAPWLGAKTINESQGDSLASDALATVQGCTVRVEKQHDLEKFIACVGHAEVSFKKAERAYIRDCEVGNKTACFKYQELISKWNSTLNAS